jgi:Zn-dependent protease
MQAIRSFLSVTLSKETVKGVLRVGLTAIAIIVLFILGLKLVGIRDSVDVVLWGVTVNISFWTLIAIAIFWVESTIYVKRYQKGEKEFNYSKAGVLLAVLVIISVIVHEMGHAIVATWFGNRVLEAKITWWGGFVRPSQEFLSISPLGQIAIALAGPATNILFALISAYVVSKMGESLFENSVQYFAYVNIRFAKYNLIPFLLLLDGGKALRGFLTLIGVSEKIMSWLFPLVGLLIYVTYRVVAKGKESLEEKLTKI